ncbi:MAG: hypothetical protein JXD19_11880 [Deltaproteobacteria bacterium]|nr:hypothetical protein [Deltaproteobacteria bacterium]
MKLWNIFRIFPCFLLILGPCSLAYAEDSALEALLQLFENKALVTAEEAQKIRQALERDQERLLQKEQELEDKSRALAKWEEELKGREDLLETTERAEAKTTDEKIGRIAQKGGNGGIKDHPAVEKGRREVVIPLQAIYRDGACLSSVDDEAFSLCVGGLLQSDYRYFEWENEDPEKNRFDLRRVRLSIAGHITPHFDYKFEYEFEGAGSRRLLDAYVDARIFPFLSLRMGQFKEPFSLEQYTQDKNLFFAERSMGYYLTPGRDVGLMAFASVWDDRFNYAVGFFNGDGMDDATGGDVDDPEWTGRVVFAPFKNRNLSLFDQFQVGGSLSYARIDRNNVSIHVKTAGLTNFFDVATSAKFNIIREVDDRNSYGAELGWAYGPFALLGEYTRVTFRDITTSSDQFSTDLENYYIAFLWMVTGERPCFRNGIFQPIRPRRSCWEGGWGGLGLALRYNYFAAERSVYDNLIFQGNSVREAKGYTIALNWYLNAWARLILDATRTRFDRPLLVGRDSLRGIALYSDHEDVLTARFQLGF